MMAGRGGGDPRPGVPALPLGPLAGGADLPPAVVSPQARGGLGAGHPRPSGQVQQESGGDPQDIGLLSGFQEVPQAGAGLVHLVPADEVEAHPVGESVRQDLRGEFSLGMETQAGGQPHRSGPYRVGDVLGGDPLPGADQGVPGLFPHVGQVHSVDAVGDPSGAAHVLAFDPGGRRALFLPAGLVQGTDRHGARATAAASRLVQSRRGEPAAPAHCLPGVPGRAVEEPLGPARSGTCQTS